MSSHIAYPLLTYSLLVFASRRKENQMISSKDNTKISTSYNGTFDILKLLFTFVICLFHCYEITGIEYFFPSGAEAVEFLKEIRA